MPAAGFVAVTHPVIVGPVHARVVVSAPPGVLAFFQFRPQQRVEIAQIAVMLAFGLLGQTPTLGADRRQTELFALLGDHTLLERDLRAHRARAPTRS